MTKLTLILLLFACSAFATTSRPDVLPKGDKTMNSFLPDSSVGLNFCSVSSDRRGGVWLTGTAWSLRGLLINDRDGELTTRLTPGVKKICQSRFTSADTGWMVERETLWKSTDAGMSWQQLRIPDLKRVSTFHFYDSQNGWVGGWAGEIYRTTDAGQTWIRSELPLKYSVPEIQFVDSLNGWAVGYQHLTYQQRMIALFRTEDGGRTWRQLANVDADATGGVRSLFFVNQSTGWGIGTRQRNIVQTTDGGETWTIKLRRENSQWNSVFFADERRGWAVGSGIAYTSDGGANWSYQLHPLLSPGYLESIIFTDAKHGWAVGPSVIMRTNDAGKTWRKLPDTWQLSIPEYQSLVNDRP